MWMDGAPIVAPFSSIPYPWANQGGELKLTLTFFALSLDLSPG
jgi:hypothetical protein